MSTRLNLHAREQLRAAGISQAQWARQYFGDGRWHGDECGCPDDRCIGFHHDAEDDCGCLPALLDENGGR
ncbi:hypothetical protein QRX50_46300 [Amycolatopsis carbonis]|uniref:Uncharacterized protein n=1 Tax=Amycolatopsis carbonis TaxID=715471 RepID=A0A9Y2IEX6_9PSEU|nr:hypothetical protein [Amycolatopsis sp. 2-15]WIX78674.1 hypothetical protein QRX50_46300 [Amycolatopsis sp. 2-15]